MSFIPFIVLWCLMAFTVLWLFVWRKIVASKEDDNLHVLDGSSVAKSSEQVVVAQKLDVIDHWGKVVTIVVVVYGVILAGAYVWQSWVQNTHPGA